MSRFLIALLLAVPAAAAAQQAPIFVQPGHWATEAVQRLGAAGVAPPVSDPWQAPMTYRHARQVFRYAIEAGEERGLSGLAELARSYLEVLDQEIDSASVLARAEVAGGWSHSMGEALGGDGYFEGEDWTGARAAGSARGPAAMLRAGGHAADRIAWQAEAGRIGDAWVMPVAGLAAALGPFDIWAGRRRLHYGAGRSGGVVLGSSLHAPATLMHRTAAPFDGVGVHVRDPFEFPSPLRFLGPARIEIVGGRMKRSGRIDRPWVVFGRLTGAPFSDRIMLGVNRGAIFGGEGNAVTARRLVGLLVGVHGGDRGEFENQIFSVVGSYRPPLAMLPLEVYGEYGMDDTAGAISDVPAWVAGVRTGALPALPALSLALEKTRFSGSCCGNTIWYRSIFFRGSWHDEGRLFAHPLGGHGQQWLAHARLDLPHRGILGGIDLFTRKRGRENLFSPEREGRSRGASGVLDLRAGRSLWLRSELELEVGEDWRQERAAVLLSWRPPLD